MTLGYSYSSLGQVDELSRDGGDALTVKYDYAGSYPRQRIYSVPEVTTSFSYDDDYGRLTRIQADKGGSDLVNFVYSYDKNGNITSQVFDHRTGTNSYLYDTLDRLTRANYIGDENEQFVYDKLGNRLTLSTREELEVVYSHDIANEYTKIGSCDTLGYDAAGNLTRDAEGYCYYYDYENRVTSIKLGGALLRAAYSYDALGRRVQFISGAAPFAVTTRYYYDGWRVLSETNGADSHQRDYVYGNYPDEVLVMADDDDHYYVHDHLYSPVALIAEDGTGL